MSKIHQMYSKSSRKPRKILNTDKCDWCQKKKAELTDGTYVFCSEGHKKKFRENVFQAMDIEHAVQGINNC